MTAHSNTAATEQQPAQPLDDAAHGQANVEHLGRHGRQLETRCYGEPGNPLVVLLHGFPECWATWRHQIAPLVNAGYRVLVPNMIGYGHSDKPSKIADYRMDMICDDVRAVIRAAGYERCHLVGHDWGGAIAWWFGIHYSDELLSLSILNAPHPRAFLSQLRSSPKQLLKSWYIFFFQLPWLPEWVIRMGNYRMLADAIKTTSNPGAYQPQDWQQLNEHWRIPGALTAKLNYYRAMLRYRPKIAGKAMVSAPTQILWGEKDLALTLSMAESSQQRTVNGRLITYPDATHWLAHDKPQEINERLLEWIAQHMEKHLHEHVEEHTAPKPEDQ
ncbi:alpha/beta fold hydrolase [Bacterioplanes sanyensis]|nr:alpha/beta hydrolase [Bacterioplanes sanyensis]